jgi:hypothetical protein
MSDTQRICIKEVCRNKNTYDFTEKTHLRASNIKRVLCETNSYVDIKKTLVACYKIENPTTNTKDNVKYAFLDVCWRDTEQGKELQAILSEENGEATIVVNDTITWYITPQNEDDNLYDGTIYSMTTIYLKVAADLDTVISGVNPSDASSFFGIMFLDQDADLPRPIPMYRNMRNEFIIDKGDVNLDELF